MRFGRSRLKAHPGQALGPAGPHVTVAVPLGLLQPDQLAVIAAVETVVVTPWRGLVLVDAADRLPAFVAAGLIADDDSAWTMISACVGSPWCASGRADTQRWARELAAAGRPDGRVHISGCPRRCGAPAEPHRDLVG